MPDNLQKQITALRIHAEWLDTNLDYMDEETTLVNQAADLLVVFAERERDLRERIEAMKERLQQIHNEHPHVTVDEQVEILDDVLAVFDNIATQ